MLDSDLFYAAPEIFLATMASIILILDRTAARISPWITYLLSQVTLVIAFMLTLRLWGLPQQVIF